MSNFSRREKLIAELLSYAPGLKGYIKRVYQYVNYIFYSKGYKYKCDYAISLVSEKKNENFFGYYDKSPESQNGEYTIFQESVSPTNKKPLPTNSVNIILKNNKTNEEVIIDKSNSYNWQQGTKLQWITADKFIFNFYNGNSYSSKIISASEQKEVSIVDYPIYDCFKDKFGLSLNFNRLAQLRPDYGYRNIEENIDFDNNDNDGIFFIDLINNDRKLIVSLQKVINLNPKPSMKNAKHKFNHIMISPNGDKFMFMHRWFIPGGKKFDRLFISDIKGEQISLLCDNDMVSHCCWYNNETIVGYFRHDSFNDTFYKIDTKTLNISLLSDKLINYGDGHPSFCGSLMVFDAYPDRSRQKSLFIYDIEADTVKTIGNFLEPVKYFGENRCDLHPKWDFSGNSIFVDSVHTGKRKLIEIKL